MYQIDLGVTCLLSVATKRTIRFLLRDVLRYNLQSVCARLLKEAFRQLWDYNSATWAGKFLDEW